jgi:hypothetical protein
MPDGETPHPMRDAAVIITDHCEQGWEIRCGGVDGDPWLVFCTEEAYSPPGAPRFSAKARALVAARAHAA